MKLKDMMVEVVRESRVDLSQKDIDRLAVYLECFLLNVYECPVCKAMSEHHAFNFE